MKCWKNLWQSLVYFGSSLEVRRIEHQVLCADLRCPASFILVCCSSLRVFSFRLLLPVSILKAYQLFSGTEAGLWLGVLHSEASFCSLFAPFKLILKIKKSFMKSKY